MGEFNGKKPIKRDGENLRSTSTSQKTRRTPQKFDGINGTWNRNFRLQLKRIQSFHGWFSPGFTPMVSRYPHEKILALIAGISKGTTTVNNP